MINHCGEMKAKRPRLGLHIKQRGKCPVHDLLSFTELALCSVTTKLTYLLPAWAYFGILGSTDTIQEVALLKTFDYFWEVQGTQGHGSSTCISYDPTLLFPLLVVTRDMHTHPGRAHNISSFLALGSCWHSSLLFSIWSRGQDHNKPWDWAVR